MDRLVESVGAESQLENQTIAYNIQTFGCKVNTYDSGLIQQRFSKFGFLKNTTPQVFVLNTCAVTAEATKEAVREVRRIKTKNPHSTVVVTGCAAQVDKDSFENLPGVDLVVANSHKGQLEDLIQKHLRGELTEKIFHSNIFKKIDLEAGGGVETDHTRSFLKIQDGCNSFCTYCVIPFARGKSRSLEIPYLVERVNELYTSGAREAVLTGVHIGDYEDVDTLGNKKSLEDLIEAMLTFTKMPRFRLSSLEPIELSSRLLSLYKNPKMCRHFHMSIQSANTRVLAAMKRKYTAQGVERALTAIAEQVSGSFVGMDVIVGFPGETREEFEDTYARLARLPWTRIHVFPYSQRPGTKATQYENQVPRDEIMKRSAQLRELSSERYSQCALDQIGSKKSALLLRKSNAKFSGLTSDYWNVQLASDRELETNCEYEIEITGYDHSLQSRMDGVLVGRVL